METKNRKHVYIETFGCQMNERDSEIMKQQLAGIDYLPTSDLPRADLILVNTCSIRAKAEQKVYSLLGRLKKNKKKNPSLIIVVAGCVAQQEGEKLPARMPHVDIVVGTQHIHRLAELLTKVQKNRSSQIATGFSSTFKIPRYRPPFRPQNDSPPTIQDRPIKKFVTIMQGCNNFCTYCVVPRTRGREISRPAEDVLSEIKFLAENGVREVTLLGQNVNSYNGLLTGSGIDGANKNFPELLRMAAKVEGIERLRFTTSHPKDLSEELLACFAEIEKLCPHFHLPVQSGSNRILKRMNRKYTIDAYLEKVAALRAIRTDIALTTDIIVGFPGETREDFAATMNLLETVRFHSAFSFKYSDRPMAKAAAFNEKVPEPEKSRRLRKLQARQDEITLERNIEFIGKQLTVMTEGLSKTAQQWSGRTGTNHVVNFTAQNLMPGEMVEVIIEKGCLHSLRGRLATSPAFPVPLKQSCGILSSEASL